MSAPIYGLLGRSLSHSWSVPIHRALGCDSYHLIEREPEELKDFLRDPDIAGLNVTIPYKTAVMSLCDVIAPEAAAIGSVNTIVRQADGRLHGYNTDLTGFRYMVRRCGLELRDRKVLILGGGGASLTVRQAAVQAGAADIVTVTRGGSVRYEDLTEHRDAEILVNATPVGMYPRTGETLVDLRDFPRLCGVLDLIYNPQRTRLLLQAEALGIPWSDGLPMLVAQAVAAEELFFGRSIPESETERILNQLRFDSTNLVLIGMPGCGKSTVGQALGQLTGREVIETDRRIVERAGRTIPELFADRGEAYFRELEREEVEPAGRESGKIIVTGGGVVKDRRNYDALRQNGRIYQLERSLSLLAREGRPLSQAGDLEELWRERQPLYESFRDAAVDNSGTPEDTAAMIWRDFNEYFGH